MASFTVTLPGERDMDAAELSLALHASRYGYELDPAFETLSTETEDGYMYERAVRPKPPAYAGNA